MGDKGNEVKEFWCICKDTVIKTGVSVGKEE